MEAQKLNKGQYLELRKNKYAHIRNIRNILIRNIKKTKHCKGCNKILPYNDVPIVCDSCQKEKLNNFLTLNSQLQYFRNIAALNINNIYELKYPERFILKEMIRGMTLQKPCLPYKFESILNANKKDITEDHINGCTKIANAVIINIRNKTLKTNKDILDFVWQKSARIKTTKYQNNNSLKEIQNEDEYKSVSINEYINIVGKIVKSDGKSVYSKKETIEILNPYFL